MKFREPPRACAYHSTADGPIPLHALYCGCRLGFLLREAHLPGRKRGLTAAQSACQRGELLFYLPVQARRAGVILWEVYVREDLNHRRVPTYPCHGGGLPRVRLALRADKVLRRHGDH